MGVPHWWPTRRQRRRLVISIGLALLAASGGALLELTDAGPAGQDSGLARLLYAVDGAFQDSVLSAREPDSYLQQPGAGQARVGTDPRDLIAIVGIDEKTIAELGAYNGGYPRRYHAQVVDQLLSQTPPPRVIVFDVGFFEATADDDLLASAFKRARADGTRIVLATVGQPARGATAPTSDGKLLLAEGLTPVPVLAGAAELGLANVLPDSRGTIRSMPLLARVGDIDRPTLGLAALAGFLRRPSAIDGRPAPDSLEIAGRRVPVDATSSLLINYFGPPYAADSRTSTFAVASFVDVLRGRTDPSVGQDGIVFVGALGAAGLAEDYWTPVSTNGHKMAGVEIHANVVATLFSTQFLRFASIWSQVLLTFGLALLVGVAAATARVLVAWVAFVVLLGAYALSCALAMFSIGLVLPLAAPLLAGIATFGTVVANRVVVEQRQTRALETALASVVPSGVAAQIAREPERIALGSQRRELTVLFADLEGFTTFAERSDAGRTSQVVTEFLEAMTATVIAHGGTVDKFIGDAIMALWNAPLDDPQHAQHACAAAVQMQAALEDLNERWLSKGWIDPRQRMRVGVHSGPADVGNVGSHQRFAYTAIGDTVNLAARLESLNAAYGSRVCISESTLDLAGGPARWLVRFLDRVTVKGRATPVVVFELLGAVDDVELAARLQPLLDSYNRAMVHYQARDFETAGKLFLRASSASDDQRADGPSATYAQRCAAFSLAPPAEDWDGVFALDHK